MSPPRAFVSWSSGKDAAFALYTARRSGLADIVGVLTTVNEAAGRVAMHGVRNELLDRQVAALGLPAIRVPLPYPCSNEDYEERMAVAIAALKAQGVRHLVFGDLFLEDVRAWREARLAAAGMTPLFPLWRRHTGSLARDMIRSGVSARLVCVDPGKLDRGFAGRRFDEDLLAALPADCDPCGENGEFHTFVTAGPMLSAPIAVSIGAVVERDGFVFADAVPAPAR